MNKIRYIAILLLGYSASSLAYINCQNVPVNAIEVTSSSTFHGLSKGGATGTIVFISVSKSLCTTSNGEDIDSGIYLVIDEYDTSETQKELKKYISSLLLTAKATGKTITFHGSYGGESNSGAAVIEPYYVRLN